MQGQDHIKNINEFITDKLQNELHLSAHRKLQLRTTQLSCTRGHFYNLSTWLEIERPASRPGCFTISKDPGTYCIQSCTA